MIGREFLCSENCMHPYISLFGRQIGTYGLCMAVAVIFAAILAAHSAKKAGICVDDVIIVGSIALGIGIFSGWLLYILVTYSWQQVVAMIRSGNLQFLNGGIVFYGGLVGGIGGALLGTHMVHRKFSDLSIHIIPCIPLAHAIGRVGCTMAGCCHGFEYDGFLAIYYPKAVSGLSPKQGYFPIQLIEAALNMLLWLGLLRYKKKIRNNENILFAYLVGYGIIRFSTEFFRGDRARGVYYLLSTSQWISIILIGITMTYLVLKRYKNRG